MRTDSRQTDRQTDRHDEANSRFPQIAKARITVLFCVEKWIKPHDRISWITLFSSSFSCSSSSPGIKLCKEQYLFTLTIELLCEFIHYSYIDFVSHFDFVTYCKVVQIWPGQTVTCLHTITIWIRNSHTDRFSLIVLQVYRTLRAQSPQYMKCNDEIPGSKFIFVMWTLGFFAKVLPPWKMFLRFYSVSPDNY
jgi:hypothetical protein